MPKVSVLMPAYNSGSYIYDAVKSIIDQTSQGWELIVCDDGSTDNTKQIIYSFSDSRIRYLKNENNKGIIFSRNRLLQEAKGEYIAFLDSDDVALKDRLQFQLHFLESNPDYALCGTWGSMIDENGKEIKKINLTVDDLEIKSNLLFASPFIQSSIMIRSSVLNRNPYDETFPVAEDYDLWCRLSKTYRLKNLPVRLTKYRWHETNISQSKKEEMEIQVKRIQTRELLSNLNIRPTDYESVVHSNISSSENIGLSAKEYLKKLTVWLRKLQKANLESNYYNTDTFSATICFRWIFACKERKEYSSIWKFPVSLNWQSRKILLKMIYDRLK